MELIYKIWDTHRRILSRFRDQMEPARIKTKSHRQQVVGGENKKLKEINVGAGLNNSEYLFSPSFAQKSKYYYRAQIDETDPYVQDVIQFRA